MSEAESGPFRDFQQINAVEATHLLIEGSRMLASVMVWTRDQKNVIRTHLSSVLTGEKILQLLLPKGFDAAAFEEDLVSRGEKECFFSVSLIQASIFFRSTYIGPQRTFLLFRFPERVFKIQRRHNLRLPLVEGQNLKVEFDDPLFPETRLQRKCWDISATGCSILIREDEKIPYQPHTLLKNLRLTIGERTIQMDAEVRHVSPVPGATQATSSKPKELRVGLQFVNLRPGDEQHIAGYVMEETRKYYIQVATRDGL